MSDPLESCLPLADAIVSGDARQIATELAEFRQEILTNVWLMIESRAVSTADLSDEPPDVDDDLSKSMRKILTGSWNKEPKQLVDSD